MSKTKQLNNEVDWVEQREDELKEFDNAFGKGLLRKQIEANIEFLIPHIDSQQIKVHFYNIPHIGRIVITDNFVYFSAFSSELHARGSKAYKYRKGGSMYINYLRLFNQLWSIGSDEEIDSYRSQ